MQESTGSDNSSISIVQRGNLKALEQTLRKQCRQGQNIVLCWSENERGLLVLMVPHYFLGNYCAGTDEGGSDAADNERFVRELLAGNRHRSRDQMFEVARRLEVAPSFIKLETPLADDVPIRQAVEKLVRRYGISYVDNRAVLLFDIVEFSLYTPFEQASQLNSLSYSLNSAWSKLAARGIHVDFARTTTGDGYYVWNRRLGSAANRDLFYFLLLVVADNAVARAASRGNTVPIIRCAYHVGSHYELYQAEGVNPSMFSYIVGDVTIDLARMLDVAAGGQILVGDFTLTFNGKGNEGGRQLDAPSFVRACNRGLSEVRGLQLAGQPVSSLSCRLSSQPDGEAPRRFRIVDKHGLSHLAYNLEATLDVGGKHLHLGADPADRPAAGTEGDAAPAPRPAASAEDMIEDLVSVLKKRDTRRIVED